MRKLKFVTTMALMLMAFSFTAYASTEAVVSEAPQAITEESEDWFLENTPELHEIGVELETIHGETDNSLEEAIAAEKATKESVNTTGGQVLGVTGLYTGGNAEHSANSRHVGMFKLTSYCPGHCCNGKWTTTALGTPLQGNVIAVDPKVIPLGSLVEINVPGKGWQQFRAEDIGGGVKGNHIDVLIGKHGEQYNPHYNTNGARSVEVRIVN